MRMGTLATMPPFDRCNESGCCCFNCRETVSLFANYTSSKGVSMETMETSLDPSLRCLQLELIAASINYPGTLLQSSTALSRSASGRSRNMEWGFPPADF